MGGRYGADAHADAYFRSERTDDSWPLFEKSGLATPTAAVADADVCAGEVATAVAREGRARCLALAQVARGADAPAALSWRGATHHMTAQELSAVLRSWEHRSGVRVVGVGHGALYLSVAAPPTEAHQARVLAAEHYLVCPDVFHEDPDLDWSTYHEELMRLREWRFWWD
ncbi:DUF4253 domain-containing protein [Streptomyces rubiginosohelvolus]|uniref:DUF4253 domain-containing protein n=1 Tax=Streptomyces rubiginosohelvolus TaxID=67362 RepID=UPI003825F406